MKKQLLIGLLAIGLLGSWAVFAMEGEGPAESPEQLETRLEDAQNEYKEQKKSLEALEDERDRLIDEKNRTAEQQEQYEALQEHVLTYSKELEQANTSLEKAKTSKSADDIEAVEGKLDTSEDTRNELLEKLDDIETSDDIDEESTPLSQKVLDLIDEHLFKDSDDDSGIDSDDSKNIFSPIDTSDLKSPEAKTIVDSVNKTNNTFEKNLKNIAEDPKATKADLKKEERKYITKIRFILETIKNNVKSFYAKTIGKLFSKFGKTGAFIKEIRDAPEQKRAAGDAADEAKIKYADEVRERFDADEEDHENLPAFPDDATIYFTDQLVEKEIEQDDYDTTYDYDNDQWQKQHQGGNGGHKNL